MFADPVDLVYFPVRLPVTAIDATAPMVRVQRILRRAIANGELDRDDPELIETCQLAAEVWESESVIGAARILCEFVKTRTKSP